MSLRTRVEKLEVEKLEARKDDPADRALAERLERARAREAAHYAELGIPCPPRPPPLVIPAHLTGIAERLAWALRAHRERESAADGPPGT